MTTWSRETRDNFISWATEYNDEFPDPPSSTFHTLPWLGFWESGMVYLTSASIMEVARLYVPPWMAQIWYGAALHTITKEMKKSLHPLNADHNRVDHKVQDAKRAWRSIETMLCDDMMRIRSR
jgi:hypothetical protein